MKGGKNMEQQQNSTEADMKRWKRQLDEFELNVEREKLHLEHIEKQLKADIPNMEAKRGIENLEKALAEKKDEKGEELTPLAILKIEFEVEKRKKELELGIPEKMVRLGIRQMQSNIEQNESNMKAILKMMRNHKEQNGEKKEE
jgi:hypothetical protein